ncbi:uroporphyrinogen-III synthase [Gilvimarinus algae]|uniref:Uroporphyrinogen-III synthase n=1 Tax=Gilvimarinus algae TaxID=3058037 RepID=A0ABT8TGA9_9GAMM|nr:uroporphyrinogen-III synthase [Gilvimarinus sp. SDUM040014]MDO3383120.1 uroporphyrinogen-III synthase [Gilvimarinus sp. SDUM040014]
MSAARVLITRPEPMASRWQQWLAKGGIQAQVIPCMAIEPLTDEDSVQAIKNRVLAFDHYQKAIFISRNAASEALKWLEDYWPQWPVGVGIYAVGEATAGELTKAGLAVNALGSARGAMNSETLLAEPDLQSVAGERIVIFKGQGGRETLARTLTERGARVDHCELYRRAIPRGAEASLRRWLASSSGQALIIAHSGESLANLCLLARQGGCESALLRHPLLVPGERVAELAKVQGFERIAVALNAGDEAMLEQIKRYQAEQ